MADFRTELYRRYVSTFKAKQIERNDAALASYWKWCEFTYLPLLAEVPRDGAILELGCGPGPMLEFLQRHGYGAAHGIDVSEEQVHLAVERGLDARVADVFQFLDADPGRYDAILAIDFVEHFTREELLRLLPAVRAALKPGGCFIVQTPNGAGLLPGAVVYGDLTHLTIFNPGSLEQLFRVTGFNDFTFRETGPVCKNLVGRVRWLLWRLVRLLANGLRRIEVGRSQAVWTENMICRCRASG